MTVVTAKNGVKTQHRYLRSHVCSFRRIIINCILDPKIAVNNKTLPNFACTNGPKISPNFLNFTRSGRSESTVGSHMVVDW